MKRNFFRINWKKFYIAVLIIFLSGVIHNLIYAVFNFEDAVFLILPFLGILYLIVSGVYSLIVRKKK
ncbi:MAG: hypothetical protein KC516_00885 [Nanoarchaeota archaeon]|nr:hypothetical protein [Nanoarchaeota archaeon]